MTTFRAAERASHLRSKLSKLSGTSLFRDAATLGTGQVVRLAVQAAYFVLIARSLGPRMYGAFAAITAFTAILSPFAGLGCGTMFVQNVRSGKTSAAISWGNGLTFIAFSGLALSCAAVLTNLLLRSSLGCRSTILICVSDLIFMRVPDLASLGFLATGRMGESAVQSVLLSVARLAAIFVLIVTHHTTLRSWIWAYLLTSVLGCSYALFKGATCWGRPRIDKSRWLCDARDGLVFSLSTSSQTVYNDIDKMMLGHLSTLTATGIYAAAYRIIDTSMTPVRSMLTAAFPRFFETGVQGINSTYNYAHRLIRNALAYGLLDVALLWVAAPLLPMLLGEQYRQAPLILRLLSAIPLLRCFHLFLADSLSGAGYQKTRTSIQVIIAGLNVVANLFILPRWSSLGAVGTSIACDAFLVLSMWGANKYYIHTQGMRRGAECEPA
jgi:O-antigen/teichoic acid export membrane protein